jgi:uncharacterized protein YqgC (DUF456 family)
VEIVLYKILFALLYIVLVGVLLTTALGIPGNWILVGVALIIALVSKFTAMTWTWLLVCLGLAVVGEIIESVLGVVVVARRGGGRWGIIGSVVGGFLGVILGAGIAPPLGSLVFGFVGAFAGAVVGEWIKQRRMEPAVRIGSWSFVGRVLAMSGKVVMGCGILAIIIARTWP